MKTGVLLVNLGTPQSTMPRDVRRFLIEFLLDKRVINLSWLFRNFLVRGIIIPKKYKDSAKNYSMIWTKTGSPLMAYGLNVRDALRSKLGQDFQVELAMRYQIPSIGNMLSHLEKCSKLVVIPLFPQYASATTGSIVQQVMQELKSKKFIPSLSIIHQFADHPAYIDALIARAQDYSLENYDHIVISFHGLPEKHLNVEDPANCYLAHCHLNAQAMIKKLILPKERYTICFQSKLGKGSWIKPATDQVLRRLRKEGCEKVLVFCPSFVADCIETVHEIGIEYRKEFIDAGGKRLDYVESLNDHPRWIDALYQMVHEQI